jgi:diguanylate cyclase (GGDEF)-like protein
MDTSALSPALHWSATLLSAVVGVLYFALLVHGQKKVRSGDALTAYAWWAAVSVTGGCGLWAAQLITLSGLAVPWQATFRPGTLGLAWGVAVAGTGALLALARRPWHASLLAALQAVGLTMLWTGLFMLGRNSLGVRPLGGMLAPAWTASALVGLASVAGMLLVLDARLATLGRFAARQWLAAGIFGLISGMAQEQALSDLMFNDQSQLLTDASTGLQSLQVIAAVGALLLLLGLFSALVDARALGRNALLASSLNDAQRRLRDQALADPLTRLPNRLLFEERLAQSLSHADDHPGALAVMFIDLDGFKPINDSFGHVAGDAVLSEVGRRLLSITRPIDLAARVGGDEFLLLIDRPGQNATAAQMAQRVLEAINQPYTLPNAVEVNLSCSVGIVMYPENGPGKKLIANADAAMYAAKRAGGSTYAFFDPSMEQDARVLLELQHDLRGALDDARQLELYYQPKVHALSGQITGVEALVRWHHPSRGLIMPGVFIPVAERFGLIGTLGNWVIEEACRQIRDWLNIGLRMRVAVNLSMHQLRQDDLVPRIRSALERYRIEPSLLTFEITESVAMEDNTVRAFGALAGVGVSLSIDDFGTAYSNFAALRKLPAKQLKIDRSLFADIHESGDALAVVDAMIKMAHALGLKVVAEGVETEAQRDLLLALNCDELQGYLYAKPMAAKMLTLWAMDEADHHPVDFRPSIYDDAAAMLD